MQKFDAIIIGSGQAGTPLVFKLAANNKKVAFIEKEHLGGTCLNIGCTPTKTYVASARRMFDVHHGSELGVEIPKGSKPNMLKIKSRKDELIKKSVDGIKSALQKNKNIALFEGTARFSGDKKILINGEEIEGEKIFINVGGRARIPQGYDGVDVMTNQEILELKEVPEHLLIVGGSYIGLEFGQMFKRFGSKVTIIEMGNRLICREDEDVSNTIKEILDGEGVEFRMNATCLSGSQNEKGEITLKVDCNNGPPKITGSHILLAVGRIPNTDTLNLESTRIETDSRGYIKVDDYLETNVPGVYALGDCNGKGAFTHTAYNDYEIIAENMFNSKNRKISDRIVTYGLFVDPPLGRAGMTLAQAKETGKKLKVGYRPMKFVARAREKGETAGFMSVVVDAETDKIMGASILGIGGDEIISSILNIMYADEPYTLIRDSVHPHPTVSELIPTMLEGITTIN